MADKKAGKKKYRHWTGERWKEGAPKAAYCDDHNTQVWNPDTKKWENCEPGEILIDPQFTDPKGLQPADKKPDGSLNPESQAAWQAKWTLLHILVHEKTHEVMIEEQVKLLHLGDWGHLTGDQAVAAGIAVAEATAKAGDEKHHVQVYMTQKALLALKIKALQEELKNLEKQREKARQDRADRDATRRKERGKDNPDQSAIDGLTKEIDALDSTIRKLDRDIIAKSDDNKKKIKFLQGEHARLEAAMQKALAPHDDPEEFRFNSALFPQLDTGRAAIAVLDPAGYERLDVTLDCGRIAEIRVTEGAYYGHRYVLQPVLYLPDLYITMPSDIFSGLSIQSDPEAMTSWARETGLMVISDEPFGVFVERAACEPDCVNAEIDSLRRRVASLEYQLRRLSE